MHPPPKKLILIQPRIPSLIPYVLEWCAGGESIPYALLTLAGCTPEDYEIKIIYQKFRWSPRDFEGQALVGITCLTYMVTEAYRLADAFRRAGSKVVLGGHHASVLPEEAARHADSVVIGESEGVWGQVLKDYENNTLQKIYRPEPLEDFFTPVFDYFMRLDPRVLARSGVHIDRGCKYHCDFCSRISQWLRTVKMEQVTSLVSRIAGARRLFGLSKARPLFTFLSDNIYSNPEYAKELFRRLIPHKVLWGGNSSIDIGFDDEALRLARASGCRGLLIGIESIHPRDHAKTSLRQFRSENDYLVAIRNIKRHGITVIGAFLIGLDSYRHADYLRLLRFIVRARFWQVSSTILTPFPGTDLFERLKQENRIRSLDWRKYNLVTCVSRPTHTSVAGIYVWFLLIRFLSVFFSCYLQQILLMYCIAYPIAYFLTQYLLRRF